MKEKTAKQLLKKVKSDYEIIAEEFDITRKKPWPEFEIIKKNIKFGRILDIGCGNGRLFGYLSKIYEPLLYLGIDNNKKLVNLAKYNYPKGEFIVGDFLNLPVENDSIDTIVSIASLHHVPSNKLRKEAVKNMWFKLKQNGILIVSVWNLFQPKYKKYINKSLFNFFVQFGKYDWNDTFIPWGKSNVKRYYHAFTQNEIKKLFREVGFTLLKEEYSNNIVMVWKKN